MVGYWKKGRYFIELIHQVLVNFLFVPLLGSILDHVHLLTIRTQGINNMNPKKTKMKNEKLSFLIQLTTLGPLGGRKYQHVHGAIY